jgi:transcription elongation factor GreA
MAVSTKLSKETYERLAAELEDLKTRGRIEVAKAIEAARALGDLSENGDYHAAKDAQGKMEARIRQLEATLEDAQIVESVRIWLRYDGDSDVEQYIVGSIEERQDGVTVISPDSALGRALEGAGEGDRVTYQTPTGAELTVEVVKVGG